MSKIDAIVRKPQIGVTPHLHLPEYHASNVLQRHLGPDTLRCLTGIW